MESYHERHYHFTPSDIDLKIRAAITCLDPRYPGVAYLYIGPIEIDHTLNPELEGMVLNMKGSFKVQVLALNNIPVRPNSSVIRIDKPYLTINFDPILEDTSTNQTDPVCFLPLEINFETDHQLKVRVDNYSTTVVVIAWKDEHSKDHRIVAQFDTREQRDIFYIFLRLLRSIKTHFLERQMQEYDVILNAEWSCLHLDLDDEEDDPEGKHSFYEILRSDTIREHLRELLRIKRELSQENLSLTDSIGVLEADLQECSKQFRELLSEFKSGKVKNLSKYEKSRSVLGELSFSILDDLKKGEKSPNWREEQLPSKEDIELQLRAVRETNSQLRKEIEGVKQDNPQQDSNPFTSEPISSVVSFDFSDQN